MQLEFGGQRIAVAAEDIVIGSDPGATVRLAGSNILPRHAVIKRLGGGLLVIQPASADAEIRVNGTRIGRDPTPLMHGDRITVSGRELRVSDPAREGATRQFSPPDQPPQPAPPAEPGPGRAAGGRLVSLTDGREYRLDVAPFGFGRDATSEVVLASPDASRRHAEIVGLPDGDVLVDLSSNGTFVNGARVSGRRELRALDVIRIGAEEFRYYPAPSPEPETQSVAPAGAQHRLGDTLMGMPSFQPPVLRPAPPPPARPLADLLVKQGDQKGERLHIRSPVVNLGRADYNDIQVPDSSVSSSHAKLQLREGVWVLADLGSTNGTFVDGIAVTTEEVALSPGCTVRLGEVGLVFEPLDEAPARVAGTAVLERPTPSPGPVSPPVTPRPRPAATPPPAARNVPVLVLGVVLILAALVALVLVL